jgi:hypothetical protein
VLKLPKAKTSRKLFEKFETSTKTVIERERNLLNVIDYVSKVIVWNLFLVEGETFTRKLLSPIHMRAESLKIKELNIRSMNFNEFFLFSPSFFAFFGNKSKGIEACKGKSLTFNF